MPSEHSSRILVSVADEGVQRDATSWRPYLKSWKRCIEEFGLNPEQAMEIPVLQQTQWRVAREKLGERTLVYAMEELEAVMQIASNAGYGAALADNDGILLGEVAAIPEFRCDNERMGSVWLENFGGTNGVGTCLIEQRPVAVFRRIISLKSSPTRRASRRHSVTRTETFWGHKPDHSQSPHSRRNASRHLPRYSTECCTSRKAFLF